MKNFLWCFVGMSFTWPLIPVVMHQKSLEMNEAKYIEKPKKRWPKTHGDSEPTRDTMCLSIEALEKYPQSEALWIIRGDLAQLVDYEDGPGFTEIETCYRNAILINPQSHEAYLELANFLDVVMDKPKQAKQYYEKARRLKNA